MKTRTQKIRNPQEKRILIVDDEENVLKYMQTLFAHNGFSNIVTASCGREVLEIFRLADKWKSGIGSNEKNIDLIVLDIVLPDIDGLEICGKVKDLGLNIPIILITGHLNEQEIHEKIVESGADDFLYKPFDPYEFMARVKLLLNKEEINRRQNAYVSRKIQIKQTRGLPHVSDKISNYLIVDTINWGKYTVLYKVINSSDNKFYALKMLTRYAMQFKGVVEKFKKEKEIMSKIQHPNMIGLNDKGIYNKCPYFVMDFVDGPNMEEYMISMGRISLEVLLSIAIGLAKAMEQMESMGILHRDIKMKNLLYEFKTGNIKLCDFGLSRSEHSVDTDRNGFIWGTPIYMAPEIFCGEEATPQSDIYSYGVTIYHLITNSPPFVAETPADLARKHMSDTPTSIHSIRPEFSVEWDDLIINKCLAKVPSMRFKSIKDVLSRLNDPERDFRSMGNPINRNQSTPFVERTSDTRLSYETA